jgi:hypothetical protein
MQETLADELEKEAERPALSSEMKSPSPPLSAAARDS